MAELHTGDRAPAFQAWDQVKNSVKLGDFEGRRLFVFFYPKADTSG